MYEQINYREIKKTQRPHRCFWCGIKIEVGSGASYDAYKNDGEFYTSYMHLECKHAKDYAYRNRILDDIFYEGEFGRGRIDGRGFPPQFDEYGNVINAIY